jgi:hypothetical protein
VLCVLLLLIANAIYLPCLTAFDHQQSFPRLYVALFGFLNFYCTGFNFVGVALFETEKPADRRSSQGQSVRRTRMSGYDEL